MVTSSAPAVAPSPLPANAPRVVEAPSNRKPVWQKYGTPLIVLPLAIAIIVTITRDWNGCEGGRIEQVTNDAYVRGDLTPLSTKVPGLVCEVKVNDYQKSARRTYWFNSMMTITRLSWRRLLRELKLRRPPSKTTDGSGSSRIQD